MIEHSIRDDETKKVIKGKLVDGKVYEEWFQLSGLFHNDDGPARLRFRYVKGVLGETKDYQLIEYYLFGNLLSSFSSDNQSYEMYDFNDCHIHSCNIKKAYTIWKANGFPKLLKNWKPIYKTIFRSLLK